LIIKIVEKKIICPCNPGRAKFLESFTGQGTSEVFPACIHETSLQPFVDNGLLPEFEVFAVEIPQTRISIRTSAEIRNLPM